MPHPSSSTGVAYATSLTAGGMYSVAYATFIQFDMCGICHTRQKRVAYATNLGNVAYTTKQKCETFLYSSLSPGPMPELRCGM